ncbi:hypothetical protein KUTeg_000456 [Tegillarca granosa]|uniref:Uncharacterized protein n=1 Tax=Tegillarca granosa TaxID=220873 RepID=A0ABQ9G0D7_TEGGR|nr:hypothetical protein KUTeg_000456 [Tegillarca granosa]
MSNEVLSTLFNICKDAVNRAVTSARKVLSEEELRTITLGVYQLILTSSYTSENLNDLGEYKVHINDDQTDIIIISNSPCRIKMLQRMNSIQRNCSSLMSWVKGRSTCSYIASFLWFLGLARHTNKIKDTTKQWSNFVADSRDLQEVEPIDACDDNDIATEE